MTLLLDCRQRIAENWMQTGAGLCNIVKPALLTPFFSYKFSILLHFRPWLPQMRWPLARRDLATIMFSKTQIYWIHAPKCPKSIGLLLGKAMMSLLGIWPSAVPLREQSSVLGNRLSAPYSNTQASEPAGKLRTGHRDFREVAPPSWTPNPRLNQGKGPFSRASAQPCTSAGSTWNGICSLRQQKVPDMVWAWVAKFLKMLTQALYLWASAIVWTGERQKWAAVAPAIPWNISVSPRLLYALSDFQQMYKSLSSGCVTPQHLLLNVLSTSYFTLFY